MTQTPEDRIDLDLLCRWLARNAAGRCPRLEELLDCRDLHEFLCRDLKRQRPSGSTDSKQDPETMAQRLRQWDALPGRIVHFYADDYPELLRHITRPPVVLFVRGRKALTHRPQVAVVGARAASGEALSWGRDLAADLSRLGWPVASGMARGVDAAAHEGALQGGTPTLAVLGCGADIAYPPEHTDLMQRIIQQGAVISEFAPGTRPRPWHFPARNRILAGLAKAVIVVQAENKSGALITARHALEQNRDVMAVPGPVDDPRSRGVHRLLKEGAILVESLADVIDHIGLPEPAPPRHAECPEGSDLPSQESSLPPTSSDLLVAAQEIAPHLTRPSTLENLQRILGWPSAKLQARLCELEVAGLVQRDNRGRFRLG